MTWLWLGTNDTGGCTLAYYPAAAPLNQLVVAPTSIRIVTVTTTRTL